jgi:hypothetical protein
MFGPTDLLHPSPAPHFKTSSVIIYAQHFECIISFQYEVPAIPEQFNTIQRVF